MKKYKEIPALIYAIFCTLTLSYGFMICGNSMIQARSFEAIAFCMMLFIVCRYCFDITNLRKTVVAAVLAGILTFFLFIGAEFDSYHTVSGITLNRALIFAGGGVFYGVF